MRHARLHSDERPIRLFTLGTDRQALLVASMGEPRDACATLFFFVVVNGPALSVTPQFGTCSPTGSYLQDGGKITITLPRMGGHTVFTFDGVTLQADDQTSTY